MLSHDSYFSHDNLHQLGEMKRVHSSSQFESSPLSNRIELRGVNVVDNDDDDEVLSSCDSESSSISAVTVDSAIPFTSSEEDEEEEDDNDDDEEGIGGGAQDDITTASMLLEIYHDNLQDSINGYNLTVPDIFLIEEIIKQNQKNILECKK